jgi:hypothetical protein
MTIETSGKINIDYSSVVDATDQVRLLTRGLTSAAKAAQSLNKSLNLSVAKIGALQTSMGTMQGFVNAANNVNTLSNSLSRLGYTSVAIANNMNQSSQVLTRANRNLRDSSNSLDSAQKRLFKTYSSSGYAQGVLNTTLGNTVAAQNRVSSVTQRSTRVVSKKAKATRETTDKLEAFNLASRNLTKSVQVALGPLSGVAARITAMTALFNANTLSAAGLISTIVGLSVATYNLVNIGINAERQYLRMIGVTEILGDKAKFTAQQLEQMSQKLGYDTLAGLNDVRDAFTTLATYTEVAEENFYKAGQAAQAMSDVFGGSLKTNINQIGRLLEDPFRNMDALRRSGIQFSKAEQENIERLRKTFQTAEAQRIVLAKFDTAIRVSEMQAMGLAGTIDTLGQKFQNLFERAAKESGALDVVNTEFSKIIKAIDKFNEDGDKTMDQFGRTFHRIAEVVAGGLRLMAENVEALNVIFKTFVAITIVKSIKSVIAFSASLLGLTKSFALVAAGLSATTLKILGFASGLGKLVILGTAIAAVYSLLSKEPEKTNEDVKKLNNSIRDTKDSLTGIPTELEIELRLKVAEIETDVSSLKTLRDEYLKIVADAKKQLEIETRRSFQIQPGGMGLSSVVQVTTPEMERLQGVIGTYKWNIQGLTNAIGDMGKELEDVNKTADESRATWVRALGDKTIGAVTSEFNSLRNQFDTTQMSIEKYDAALTDLSLTMQGLAGLDPSHLEQLASFGITSESITKLITQMAEQSPRNRGLQEMVNVVEDLNNEATNAYRQLKGLQTLDFSKRRFDVRVRELGEFGRSKLTQELGLSADATDKEIIDVLERRERNTEKVLVLSSEMQKIRNNELSTLERINYEYDQIIQKINSVSGVNRQQLTSQVEEARSRDITNFRNNEYEKLAAMDKEMNEYINSNMMSQKEYEILIARQTYEEQLSTLRDYLAKKSALENLSAEEYAQIAHSYMESFAQSYNKALENINKATDVVSKELTMLQQIGKDTGQALQNAFADFVFNPFEEGVEGMGRSFEEGVKRMVSDFAKGMQRILSDAIAKHILMNTLGITSFGSFLGISAPAATPSAGLSGLFNSTRVGSMGGMRNGGFVSGPGTGRSDSIMARLSNGEFVLNAKAVKKIGLPQLTRMNSFADGGFVGKSGSYSGGDINNNIVLNITSDGGSSNTTKDDATELSRKIEAAILQVIINEKRPGGVLAA